MTTHTLFISYSHKDTDFKDEIRAKLKVWEVQKEISVDVWTDDEIAGGDDWAQKIDQALQKSDLGILLVTDNFLSSEFILNRELPRLEEKRKESGLKLYPIAVAPCNWQASSFLKTIQMNPSWRPGQCLPKMGSYERMEDLTRIAGEIRKLLDDTPGEASPTPAVGTPLPYAGSRNYAELELGLYHHAFNVYQLEMRFGQLGSMKNNRLHRACICLNLADMRGTAGETGLWLGRLLFEDEATYEILRHARKHANRLNTSLGMRICIGANAQELSMVPWETIRDPITEEHLARSADIRFSRYLLGDGIVNLKGAMASREKNLKAMIVPARIFTAPRALGQDAGSPADDDPSNAKKRLSLLTRDITAFKGQPGIEWITLSDKADAFDILYVINSAFIRPDDNRWPTDSEGRCQSNCGSSLVRELNRLGSLPRLLVLEPPFDPLSGQTSASIDYQVLMENVVAAANQGITGVLAPQHPIDIDIWKQFLDIFFTTLRDHGDMALALSSARNTISDHEDWWIPVLLSRRKSGYLWYRVGFEYRQTSSKKWESLLYSIEKDQCLPILGPGMVQPYVGSRQYIAKTLSDRYYFPMAFRDRTNLRQVTQYLEVDYEDRDLMVKKIQEEYAKHIRKIHARQLRNSSLDIDKLSLDDLIKEIVCYHMQTDPLNPHRLLAEIPFKLYLTSNLAGVMTQALEEMVNRRPVELAYKPKQSRSLHTDLQTEYKLSRNEPMVYHLFGNLSGATENITLTENDYFEFLINFSKEMNTARRNRRIPECVYGQLTGSSLLFLGFNVREWDFHVIYRIWKSLEGAEYNKKKPNVAVQIDPDDDYAIDPKRARKYLEDLFGDFSGGRMQVNIYWGTTRDFIVDLHKRAKQAFGDQMFSA